MIGKLVKQNELVHQPRRKLLALIMMLLLAGCLSPRLDIGSADDVNLAPSPLSPISEQMQIAALLDTPTLTKAPTPSMVVSPTATLSTATSTPAAATVITNSLTVKSGSSVLFARDNDLWRADVNGENAEQLTGGGLLNWPIEEGGEWYLAQINHPIEVSPDGRRLTFSQVGQNQLLLIDVTGLQEPTVIGRGTSDVAWSSASLYLAYGPHSLQLYNVQTGTASTILTGYGGGITNLVWSPDDRFLAFSCCFAATDDTGTRGGEIQQVEIVTTQVETIGQTTDSVASRSPALCWTADAQVVPITEATQTDNCSDQSALSQISPDEQQVASLALATPTDSEPRLLIVQQADQAGTENVLWQRELEISQLTAVTWSADGQYLLLEGGAYDSPIWRVAADGSGPLDTVVEEGFLIGVVPQWEE